MIFCIATTGCEDFLTVLPQSEYSLDGFYKSQNDFDAAIAAVYAEQQELYRETNNWWRAITVRSDEMLGGEPYTNGFDRFIDGDNVSQLLGAWDRYWKMIFRCNMIIDKIDKVDFKDSDLKDHVKGEAYMLRGYAYWSLASQFGGMPIVKKPLTVEEIRIIPRSTQAETYALAEEDMKTGHQLLPEKWTGEKLGRVTKYAAAGALGRMLLYRSRFSDAKPYLKEIIDSEFFEMEEKYEDCFIDSKDNGPERVWDVQFGEGQLGEGTRFISGLLPEGTSTDLMPFYGDAAAVAVSEQFVSKYEPGDLRKDISVVTDLLINGVISNRHYISKFIRYSYTPKDMYDWANNFPLIRYTDVKMMYAEVLNEEGYVADGEAFDIINEVRNRAGLAALTSAELPNQASLREAIIHERNIEFAFEGLRWFDLVRWGIAKEVMDEFFLDPAEGGGIYSMDEFRTIFAIPADEMTRYNNKEIMWQNTGY
ncbi:MAG: RagB/SusD family nutrient uptake outer membrane protein [Bacteroidales bacterium]|nr:RagB/SusD family nutrient uptake outer membrane protein [Bacteroidales bacterium]